MRSEDYYYARKRRKLQRKQTKVSKHKLTKHHLKCRSNGGGNEPENISYITETCHRAFHTLFQNMEAPQIAELLNKKYINPEWKMIAVKNPQLQRNR